VKRSPLVRTAPLARTSGLRRLSPMRYPKPSAEKREERYRLHFAGPFPGLDYSEHVRGRRCLVVGCWRQPVQAAHLKRSRGAGGRWWLCLPICAEHHDEQHRIGRRTWTDRHVTGPVYVRALALLPGWLAAHGLTAEPQWLEDPIYDLPLREVPA
jgi:hypothetical protein